ncbi:MAG: 23S rRNA (uracil(1939)-C(5))-methyltransferase RlmD [Lachnospiraceae bacterium]|nr:23S rRNA (uracil(1939)-C(5))-methyltransferase RlmD [Lachnospiraceae bacterium]
MKKGQIYEGTVEKVKFPNKAVVVCEDGTAVVKNAIPGQRICFAVSKNRNGKAEGRLLAVIEKSPLERVPDICPQFGICGGCLYQSVPYEEQLKIKEAQVRELLETVCEPHYEGLLGSPITEGYRNKMEYTFGDEYKDGPLTLGLHKRGSFHDIVLADACHIVTEDYRKILRATQVHFAERNVPFYHTYTHEGYLRHLVVRRAAKTQQLLVNLVTSSQEPEGLDLTAWASCVRSLELSDNLVGILHTTNDSLSDVVQADAMEVLWGEASITEELLGLRFHISPFSFFQTNSYGAEVLYAKAREFVGETKDKVIFDLYSGTGTIAQMLAPVAKKVIGVEIVEEAVEAARENALANGLANCDFIAGDVLKVLDTVEEKPDLIVLDPPRDGIHPKALAKILAYGVKRMVYISCKPTSLVRDLEMIQAAGYEVKRSAGVDMFVNTGNLETICLLEKKEEITT